MIKVVISDQDVLGFCVRTVCIRPMLVIGEQ